MAVLGVKSSRYIHAFIFALDKAKFVEKKKQTGELERKVFWKTFIKEEEANKHTDATLVYA